jgi:hypothetical protein
MAFSFQNGSDEFQQSCIRNGEGCGICSCKQACALGSLEQGSSGAFRAMSICIFHLNFQVIRKTTVVSKYKAAAANLKPRKIQNTWSPALKQNLQKIVDASNAQKVLALQFFPSVSPLLIVAYCLNYMCRRPLISALRNSRSYSTKSTRARAAVR